MKSIHIAEGKRTRVLNLVFDSIPRQIRFTAETGDRPVSGRVEVAGSRWLLRKAPETQALQAENVCAKGFWDSLYAIWITPDHDTTITFASAQFHLKYLLLALAAVVAAALAAAGVMAIIRAAQG